MANQSVRIMVRMNFGVPYRMASAEAKERDSETFTQLLTKWKVSGVQLVGGFGTYGEGVDRYAHHIILEVDSLEAVKSLSTDIFRSGMLLERHSVEVGESSYFERLWESL